MKHAHESGFSSILFGDKSRDISSDPDHQKRLTSVLHHILRRQQYRGGKVCSVIGVKMVNLY